MWWQEASSGMCWAALLAGSMVLEDATQPELTVYRIGVFLSSLRKPFGWGTIEGYGASSRSQAAATHSSRSSGSQAGPWFCFLRFFFLWPFSADGLMSDLSFRPALSYRPAPGASHRNISEGQVTESIIPENPLFFQGMWKKWGTVCRNADLGNPRRDPPTLFVSSSRRDTFCVL